MTKASMPDKLEYRPLGLAPDQRTCGIKLVGPLQVENPAAEAEQILQAWLNAGGAATAGSVFELDATSVEVVDSSGIACLVYLRRRLAEKDVRLHITGISPRLYAILDLLGCLAALGIEPADA